MIGHAQCRIRGDVHRKNYRWITRTSRERIVAHAVQYCESAIPPCSSQGRSGNSRRQRVSNSDCAGGWTCSDIVHRKVVSCAGLSLKKNPRMAFCNCQIRSQNVDRRSCRVSSAAVRGTDHSCRVDLVAGRRARDVDGERANCAGCNRPAAQAHILLFWGSVAPDRRMTLVACVAVTSPPPQVPV